MKMLRKLFGIGFWQSILAGVVSGLLMSGVMISYVKQDAPRIFNELVDQLRTVKQKISDH